MMGFTPLTASFNMTGTPAISLPLAWSADGLPLGLMFGGKFGDEATLLCLAGQLERAHPWAHKKPALVSIS
jgi:amidase